ncbi:DUF2079 domain-containing protein [Elusimicrobiota bacterium]
MNWFLSMDIPYTLQKAIGFLSIIFFLAFCISANFRAYISKRLGSLREDKKTKLVYLFFAVSTAWLIIMPVLRHMAFQSHTYDLGILTCVSWNIAHGNGFYDPVLHLPSYLGDHWQPAMAIMAIFLRVWESAMLLILFQSLFLVLGAIGAYKLCAVVIKQRSWAILISACYIFSPQLHAINRFDYHPEFLAVPCILWGFYWLSTGKHWKALAAFIAMWFIKEDLPHVSAAIGVFMAFHWKDKKIMGALLGVSSAIVFVLVIFVIMPFFLGSQVPTHMDRYENLGANWQEVLRTFTFTPHKVAVNLLSDQVIWKTILKILTPMIFLPILSGWAMALPLFAALPHFLSSYSTQRALSGQYICAVLPLVIICSCYGLNAILRSDSGFKLTLRKAVSKATIWPIMALIIIHWSFNVSRYYKPISESHRTALSHIVSLVPADGSVSAQSDIGPHVATRNNLYQFPDNPNADYVIVDAHGNTWPLSGQSELRKHIEKLQDNGEYSLIAQNNEVYLFAKKPKE